MGKRKKKKGRPKIAKEIMELKTQFMCLKVVLELEVTQSL